MNRKKFKCISWIILSIIFVTLLCVFIYFKIFKPIESSMYETKAYYPENLYEEYQKEAEKIIFEHKISFKYPIQTTITEECITIKIGEYNENLLYANYLIVTIQNTGEEENVIIKRSRSIQDVYEATRKHILWANIYTVFFIFISILFLAYLIVNSIKKHYIKVFIAMLLTVIFVLLIYINL